MKVVLALVVFFVAKDLDASASAIESEQSVPQESTDETLINSNQRRYVQKYDPVPAGSNQFEGYSCDNETKCQHGGQCLETSFGGSLCNCTIAWFGPQCEFSSAIMNFQLKHRSVLKNAFLDCLNTTGLTDGVHAMNVYRSCAKGNTVCWLDEGGSDAIKVFYWCLNTGYRLLLSEGRAGSLSRWRKLVEDASDDGGKGIAGGFLPKEGISEEELSDFLLLLEQEQSLINSRNNFEGFSAGLDLKKSTKDSEEFNELDMFYNLAPDVDDSIIADMN